MKLKLKLLASMLALAAAGQASAAITQGSVQGGSSLILSVWDAVRNVSYTRNLGTNLNGFLPSTRTTGTNDGNVPGTPITGDKTPESGLTLNFAGDSLFASTFAPSLASDVQWNVTAFDNVANSLQNLSRILTTTQGEPLTINGGITLSTQGMTNYLTTLDPAFASANSVAVTDPGSAGYAGGGAFGDDLNGGLQGSSSQFGFGTTLDFFYLARSVDSGSGSFDATKQQFGNSSGTATWTLAADGTATYALAGEVAAVPVPAAAWLLASGLVVGLKSARRRKAAAKAA